MADTVSADIPKFIVAGVDVITNRALSNPIAMEYPNICTEKRIDKETGIYNQLGNIGPAEDLVEGNEVTFDKIEEAYQTTIQSATKAKGVAHSWVAVKNDLYNVVPQILGKVMVDTLIEAREQSVADRYNHGFATTGADGVYHFSASHPLVNSTELNDNLATSGAMSVEIFKEMYNQFLFIKGQSGRKFPTKATHLLFHPAKMFTVMELLESNLLAFELSNTTNSLKGINVKPVTSRYLDYNVTTGLSPYFMLDKTQTDAGVIFQRQTEVEIDLWRQYETMEFRALVAERYQTGVIAPGYGIVASLGGYTA